MKKALTILLTIVLLGAAGCGVTEAESSVSVASEESIAQHELATNLQDIAGTWEGVDGAGGIMRIEQNGTWILGYNEDNLDDGLRGTAEVHFEGTRLYLTETSWTFGAGEICENTGIYEVQLLDDGHIKFVVIKDDCKRRVDYLQGDTSFGISVKWRPLSIG